MRARVWVMCAAVWALVPGVLLAQPQQPQTRPVPVPAGPAHIDVIVIEADVGDAGFDPALRGLEQLRRGVFAMFSAMRQVSRTTLPLTPSPIIARLPDGTATLNLVSRSANGRYTFHVHLAQGTRGGDLTFVANPGQALFTVRSSRPEHAMILGFVVHP